MMFFSENDLKSKRVTIEVYKPGREVEYYQPVSFSIRSSEPNIVEARMFNGKVMYLPLQSCFIIMEGGY